MNNFKEEVLRFAEEKSLSNRELSILLNTRVSTLESWLYRKVIPTKETQRGILSLIRSIEQYKTADEYIEKNTKDIMKCIDLLEKNNIRIDLIKDTCVKMLMTRREFLDNRKKRLKPRAL